MAKAKSNVSAAVLNRIRETASTDYKNAVPLATEGADVIKEIGKIIIDSPNLQNEFINSLINRIGKTIINARLFENPLKMFNKGELEFGSVIEEVFTDLCKPFQFSEDKAEQNIYKRVIPDVKTAFHVVNSEIFYKQTVSDARIRRAFTSLDGVEQLIRDITTVMYTASNYDEYIMVKYLIARSVLDGSVALVDIDPITDKASADNALTYFKDYSNRLEFLSTKYNIMGVHTSSPKASQYLITDTHNDAFIGVNSLAYMFGPAFADDDTKKVRVDSFSDFDETRLKILLDKEDSEDPIFSAEDVAKLAKIQAVLVDESFFQIWYQLIQTLNKYNEEGLNYNIWLHTWKVYGRSPFANIVVFADGLTPPTPDGDS